MPRKAGPTRVTTVLDFIDSHWKQFWLKSVGFEEAERIGRESTAFGSHVHAIAENYLIGAELPEKLTDREKFCGNLLVNWCKQAQIKPLELNGQKAVEVTLESKRYGITGHPDLVCTFGTDPTVWVVDWKTSKNCRRSYPLQLAAYSGMIEEQYGIVVDDGVIVRTPSDPNVEPQFETHTFHGLRTKYFPMFLCGLDVYNYFNKRDVWRDS